MLVVFLPGGQVTRVPPYLVLRGAPGSGAHGRQRQGGSGPFSCLAPCSQQRRRRAYPRAPRTRAINPRGRAPQTIQGGRGGPSKEAT